MSRERPGWTAVGLGVAAGFLVGVLLVVALGVANGTATKTKTVTVAASPPAGDGTSTGASATTRSGATVVKLVAVPDVTGQRLDVAESRMKQLGFLTERKGGGLFGVQIVTNWDVQTQEPAGGTMLQPGSTVKLHVTRR